MEVIVIGAGASGLIAALKASENNHVTLIEKNDRIGKKILVTGNGKCNLWNENLFNCDNLNNYYNTDSYELLNKIFLYKDEVYNYITKELGIIVKNKNGYIYPYSNSAQSIRELFERLIINNKNIELVTNSEVIKIVKEDNEYNVITNSKSYICDKLIISCGTNASNLGSDTLNNLLNNIDIIPFKPALVPIKLNESFLKEWDGIRVDAKLSLYNNDKFIKVETGELQLTSYGISGIVSFNLSSYINSLSGNKYILIDFMPDYTKEKLMDLINKSKNKIVEDFFETIFNYKLLFLLLKKSNIKRNALIKDISYDDINILINNIKEFKCIISGTLDFDRAQISCGGISLNEVSSLLELKKLPNVYVTGEILNIDGICGGFNLANAFITGFIAGSDLND